MLLQSLESSGPMAITALIKRSSLSADTFKSTLDELFKTQRFLLLNEHTVIAANAWLSLKDKIDQELTAYQRAYPLKAGMPREELKSKLGFEAKIFNLIVERAINESLVMATGSSLHAPDFQIQFSVQQQQSIDMLLRQFKSSPWNTPSIKESEQIVGPDVLSALIDQGTLIKLSDDVLLLAETYQSAVETIKAHLLANKTITVAQVRDLFGTSRKYALAFMEHLDVQGVTKRVGDERMLRRTE